MLYTFLVLTIFPGVMIFAALTDMFTMKIPNRLSIVLVVGFLILAPFSGINLNQFGMHILAGVSMLGLGFLFYIAGWTGAGDIKLFSATALWFGFNSTLLTYSIMATLAGGVLILAMLIFSKFPLPEPLSKQKWLVRLHNLKDGAPYGIALSVGAILVFPSTFWIQGMAS